MGAIPQWFHGLGQHLGRNLAELHDCAVRFGILPARAGHLRGQPRRDQERRGDYRPARLRRQPAPRLPVQRRRPAHRAREHQVGDERRRSLRGRGPGGRQAGVRAERRGRGRLQRRCRHRPDPYQRGPGLRDEAQLQLHDRGPRPGGRRGQPVNHRRRHPEHHDRNRERGGAGGGDAHHRHTVDPGPRPRDRVAGRRRPRHHPQRLAVVPLAQW